MLETGPSGPNFATAVAARHPIDELQRSERSPQDSPYQDIQFLRSVYGSALAMEIAAERQMVQREKQMGLDHLAAIYEDSVNGTDFSVSASDFMCLPDDRPEMSKAVLHQYMARHLK